MRSHPEKRGLNPGIIILIVIGGLLTIIVGVGVALKFRDNPVSGETNRGNVSEPDHEIRERVRAWLRENLDSGEWEEVRWWGSKRIEPGYVPGQELYDCLRIKLRTKSPSGGTVLRDFFFLLNATEIISLENIHQSDPVAEHLRQEMQEEIPD
jgi:hypothetical protein